MATPDPAKQGRNVSLKKHLMHPFRSSKPSSKSATSPTKSKRHSIHEKLATLSPYQYKPLDLQKKSIRLLEILPGPDFSPIHGKIIHCDLDDLPSYIALSYTWDHGSGKKHIECQGTNVQVGENLWNFFHQYRHNISMQQYNEKIPPTPVPLWIDALCIDQQNFEERAQQVSQMRDIYTGADSVLVWLGKAGESEELAFFLLRHPNLVYVTEMATAFVDLLNKPYWSRVWVVQEFVLAKSVEVWCGDFRIDVTAFESVWRNDQPLTGISALSQQILNTQGWPLFKYRRDFRHSRQYRRELLGRRNSKSLKSTFRLRDLLQSFSSSQSTEVYDKVYGFLGIASKGREDQRIQPDYKKPPVELLVDVLHNQCHNTAKKGDEDNYKFLVFLRRILKVSRMELPKHVLQQSSSVEKHIYVLVASDFMVASVSFISTISDIGVFVEHAEAFQESTWKSAWKTTWSRSSMHPKSLTNTDVHQLRPYALSAESAVVLSFADQHITDAMYLGKSEELRQTVIAESTDIVVQSLIKPKIQPEVDARIGHRQISNAKLRQTFFRSLAHSSELHLAARHGRSNSEPNIRYERYATFVGTNGIIGFACMGGGASAREIATGDRICVFSDATESSNAFIVRLTSDGNWAISGFAIVMYPAVPEPKVTGSPRLIQHVDTQATMIVDDVDGGGGSVGTGPQALETDKKMCFHCHLTDLLELSRCNLLSPAQMERMLELSLRGEPEDEVHRCRQGVGKDDVLEFGLLA